MEKVFIVFNTAFIGDMLVTNTLVRNIKSYYPEAKVVFVCNTPFVDVAKYQDGVDDVVIFDKKKDKSLKGILNFAKNFPYKKPFASFITYANERNLLISRLIGAKHIISHNKFPLWNTKEKFELKEYVHMKDKWGGLIEPLVGEHKNLPIKYCPPETNTPVVNMVKTLRNPVVVCTTSNFYKKDMKVADCVELMRLLHEEGYTPVLTGAGKTAEKFNVELKKLGYFEYVDLINCTNFAELANIMKVCNRCITVDTGTLHFANALQVPVVEVFYDGCAERWASDETLYKCRTLIGENVTPIEIINAFKDLNNEVSTIL